MYGLIRRNSDPFRIFDNFFNNDEIFAGLGSLQKNVTPAVNIAKTSEGYDLQIAAPGFSRDSFDIDVENGQITISGNADSTYESGIENLTLQEFSRSSFKRSFSLPKNANVEQINARYETGILTISIPSEFESKKKIIDVK